MGQLTITLSDELEHQVRDYASSNGYDSVSDLAREVLANKTSGRPTYWERAYLVHLMEIKKLQGAEVNEELLDALKHGYTKYYSLTEYGVTREDMSDDEQEFVMQVLEMYAHLQYSYKESGVKDDKLAEQVQFEGFDGNAGDGHLGFLQFLVRQGKYAYVEPLDKGHAINSHMSVTGMYQRMLAEYKKIKQDPYEYRPLTLEELKRVIDARVHPEYRKQNEPK